jgi:hypothetical protein
MYNVCVFTVGLVNNLGFNVIVAFSQQLASSFAKNYFLSIFVM